MRRNANGNSGHASISKTSDNDDDSSNDQFMAYSTLFSSCALHQRVRFFSGFSRQLWHVKDGTVYTTDLNASTIRGHKSFYCGGEEGASKLLLATLGSLQRHTDRKTVSQSFSQSVKAAVVLAQMQLLHQLYLTAV